MHMKAEMSGFVEEKTETFFGIILANLAVETGGMLFCRQARCLPAIRVCSRDSRAETENFGAGVNFVGSPKLAGETPALPLQIKFTG